jgi:hypothetical protein
MATTTNKNIKYQSRESITSMRKKLKDTTVLNSIKQEFIKFIGAIKTKHLS